jgi:hypothetical protein
VARVFDRPAARVLLAWVLLSAIFIRIKWQAIAGLRFGDPDDALRLVQVRDLLAGQAWFDLHQYRIMAPEGVLMHWSRLVDIPLAGMMLALRPLLGTAHAELVTLVAVPLLTLLCALLLVGRLAMRMCDLETVGIACLVMGTASSMLFQMMPMRIDHHGWQIVLALAALNGLAARDPRKGGLVIGCALATLLAISIEGLPLTAVFLGVCALRGLRNPQERFAWLAHATLPLALTGIAAFLGTRGLRDLATHCDSVSPIHLLVFCWVAAGAGLLRAIGPRPMPVQIGILAGMGAGALGLMLVLAPECRGGAFVALDPLVRGYWYVGVAEGLPFWRSPTTYAANTLVVPLVGMLGCAMMARRTPDAARRWWWIDCALVLAGAWAIGLMVARASATSAALSSVPVAALVLMWITRLRDEKRIGRRILGYLPIIPALLPWLLVVAWNRAHPVAHNQVGGSLKNTVCNYNVASEALGRLPATDIFAPLDIGPDLLVRTHDRVIATGHHRASAGMHDVIAAFIGRPDEAHRIITARHATLVAVCPDVAEPHIYAQRSPGGLMAQLLAGKPPAWLEPVDLAPGANIRFWRVKR